MTHRARTVRRPRLLVLAGLFALALATHAVAHVRLRDPTTLAPLSWPTPGAISVVISSRASPDLSDAERITAIQNAIAAWNDVPASALTLAENLSPVQKARNDFEALDLHQVRFDDGDSGFFPELSGIVAVTPVKFFRGSIVDADILFNDAEFEFTASGEPNRIDVQDVATHELGHFIGLDHSGVGGATMYPFVSPGVVLQRSLSADDANGAAAIAPAGPLGRIEGRIRRQSDASPVSGAHVSATDASGRTVSGALTRADGSFQVVVSDPGSYALHVNPLGGVVGAENLAAAQPIHTDFEAFAVGAGTFALAAGQTLALGDLFAPPDVFVQLGMRADSLPLRALPGGPFLGPYLLGGQGLVAGSTLSSSDPEIAFFAVQWQGFAVRFFLQAAVNATPGHADLLVTTLSGDVDLIPGAIEITPADPFVGAVDPEVGLHEGGTVVMLFGSGFRPGARVVLGEHVYSAGNGLEVLDDATVEILTRPSAPGLRDVVLIDATGVEGRLADGFRFTSVPVLDSVFPSAGDVNGGTLVILEGRDFEEEVVVRIAGDVQPFERVDDSTLRVTTAGGVLGTHLLEVENPGGHTASGVFDYAAGPDPTFTSISPSTGRAGERVSIVGRGFSPDTTVVFGADPQTGAGGTTANTIAFVGVTELQADVPPLAPGSVSVMVRNAGTGQASLTDAAFTVQATPGGGGGGGCSTRFVPLRPTDVLAAGACFLVLLAWRRLARRTGAPTFRPGASSGAGLGA